MFWLRRLIFRPKALFLSSSYSLISRDPSSLYRTWLQSMLSLPPEICRLNASLIFSSGFPHHVVSTHVVSRDFFPFTLNIPVNLVPPFYLIRLTTLQFEKLHTQWVSQPIWKKIYSSIESSHLTRWLPEDPALIVPLIRSPLLLTQWKTSLPKTWAQLEVLIRVVPLPLRLVTLPRAPIWFPLWLLLRFPVRLPLRSLSMNCSKKSWRPTWRRTKDLDSRSANETLRLRYQRYIMVSLIWTAITSISSAKIISRLSELPSLIKLPLQFFFSMGTLVCAGHSSNVTTEVKN